MVSHAEVLRWGTGVAACTAVSGRNGRFVTTTQVIENIDQLLARPRSEDDGEVASNARRQAVIDGLLVKANKAAHKARRGVTTLIAIFF